MKKMNKKIEMITLKNHQSPNLVNLRKYQRKDENRLRINECSMVMSMVKSIRKTVRHVDNIELHERFTRLVERCFLLFSNEFHFSSSCMPIDFISKCIFWCSVCRSWRFFCVRLPLRIFLIDACACFFYSQRSRILYSILSMFAWDQRSLWMSTRHCMGWDNQFVFMGRSSELQREKIRLLDQHTTWRHALFFSSNFLRLSSRNSFVKICFPFDIDHLDPTTPNKKSDSDAPQSENNPATAQSAISGNAGAAAPLIECQPTGIYNVPDPNECNSYYQCEKGVRTRLSCPERQLFDVEKRDCKDYERVNCGSRTMNLADKNQCKLNQWKSSYHDEVFSD